jgi:RNA polymerase sigma factor (TIGR02999 family)
MPSSTTAQGDGKTPHAITRGRAELRADGPQEVEVTRTADGEVSRLLTAWRAREPGADERLFSAIYTELRKLAASHRRGEGPAHSLQTTALVHEAYLRLNGQRNVAWKNRGHFFALASQAMRRILVDHARRRKAAKRGGALAPSPLDSIVLAVAGPIDLVQLDIALEKLERVDPQEAKVVELRFFAGLTMPEVAAALGVSRATVERDWAAARPWLRRELSAKGDAGA